ncbi:hypothetical protein CAPTEDRAFT_125662 [Capitella teleta]|uniref:Uncharacterized protein n=1 Tax=Capitella teleta TaxID=283909 RepID=R7U3I0_CAPTE|nr:hypothetical protein CAPTEDRAFT_125662 [Capitella teleta]|eukprot:ELU00686.1 hypothetical protein CAPTEDRAFT_125662 [Capitella teleta]
MEQPNPEEKQRKLILHFDVRNTVLVADSVTQVNVEQALNSFLTSVTWGNEVNNQWEWYSDEPSLVQPRPGVITYYKHLEKRLVKTPSDRALLRQVTGDFTQIPIGSRFLPHFQKHLEYLKWTHGPVAKVMTMEGRDGSPYHYILPAFFKFLFYLCEQKRDFCIVFRTYGLDAPNVLACTKLTLAGQHPMFPQKLHMELNPIPGRVFRTESGKIAFEDYSKTDANGKMNRKIFTSELDIYNMLNELKGISAFVDDFISWQNADYHHTAAKPFWIDRTDQTVHHIFFDDNIRTNECDSIVDVRLINQSTRQGRSLDMEETKVFEDMCLVQADLLESTSNIDYFINKLIQCENNYSKYLAD